MVDPQGGGAGGPTDQPQSLAQQIAKQKHWFKQKDLETKWLNEEIKEIYKQLN